MTKMDNGSISSYEGQNIMGKMQEMFGSDMDESQKLDRSLAILNRVKELEDIRGSRGICPSYVVTFHNGILSFWTTQPRYMITMIWTVLPG
jgi:hypothetical protein